MKKIIAGKSYDTSKAKKLLECENFLGKEALYQKKTGEFFLYEQYDKYADDIKPLSYEDAEKWAYSVDTDAYYEIFVAPLEGIDKSPLTLYMSDGIIASLKKRASQAGVQISEYIEGLVRKENAENTEKYSVYFEGSTCINGNLMLVTIKNVLDEDVTLEAEAEVSDFPYLLKAVKSGIEKTGLFDDLSEEEKEFIEETYTDYFIYRNTSLYDLESDEDYGYIYEKIDEIYSHIICSSEFGGWSYEVLKASIIEQAKKHGVFPESLEFFN